MVGARPGAGGRGLGRFSTKRAGGFVLQTALNHCASNALLFTTSRGFHRRFLGSRPNARSKAGPWAGVTAQPALARFAMRPPRVRSSARPRLGSSAPRSPCARLLRAMMHSHPCPVGPVIRATPLALQSRTCRMRHGRWGGLLSCTLTTNHSRRRLLAPVTEAVALDDRVATAARCRFGEAALLRRRSSPSAPSSPPSSAASWRRRRVPRPAADAGSLGIAVASSAFSEAEERGAQEA